jgi:ribonuclease P protein component
VLPGRHRLRSSADFAAVFRGARRAGGSRSGSRLMVVHVNSTDARAGQPPRVGFVVSKAVGNAVVRNRTKRVLRALMSARVALLPQGVDVVVRANPSLPATPRSQLVKDLDRLLATVLSRVAS